MSSSKPFDDNRVEEPRQQQRATTSFDNKVSALPALPEEEGVDGLALARNAFRHKNTGRRHVHTGSGFCGILGGFRVSPSIQSFSERMVSLMVRSSLDLFYITTDEGDLLFFSTSVSRFLGWSPGELRGKNLFELLHPDELSFAYDSLRTMKPGENAFDATPRNFRVQKKDGAYVGMEQRMCTDGELLYVVQRDITHIRVEGEFVVSSSNGQEVRELLANIEDDKTRDYLLQDFTSVRRVSGSRDNRASVTRAKARLSSSKLPGVNQVGRISIQGSDSGMSMHTRHVRALRSEPQNWEDMDNLIKSAVDILDSWTLDPQNYTCTELRRLILYMFHSMNVLRLFNVEVATCRSWVEQVETHYKDNPFHNFRHAFTVLHKTWMFLFKSNLRIYLQEIDVFALLFAAVSHDLEHPGTTNNFQVNSMSDLALMYNDNSVLENHHCSVAFRILQLPGCNLLSGLEKEEQKEFRKLVVGSILGTDMTHHKAILARLKSKLDEKTGELGDANYNPNDLEDRVILATYVLHSADLSNPLAQPDVSKRTAVAVSLEFDAQAAREKELGLPVTVMVADNEYGKAKMEQGFIDFVVRPLYVILSQIAPDLKECLEMVDASRDMWAEIVKAHDKKNAKDIGAVSSQQRLKTVLSKSKAHSQGGGAPVWVATQQIMREAQQATAAVAGMSVAQSRDRAFPSPQGSYQSAPQGSNGWANHKGH